MPEGHVIHSLAEDQTRRLVGNRVIVESPQGRFQREARQLSGRRLEEIEAYGKHLFYRFSGDKTVHIHLGLYGKYRNFENPPSPPRGAVRLRVIGEKSGFDLNGPNRCQLVSADDIGKLKQRLGQDPLRVDAEPGKVWERIRKSRSPIGALLLDQSVIAGIGNIYRCEILFLHQINPQTPACQIKDHQFDEIWKTTCELMALGKELKRIVTRRSVTRRSRGARIPRERFNVYKRAQCADCGDSIYYWTLANRTVYACESCQPFRQDR